MNTIFTDASFQNILNVANKYGISSNSATDLTQRLMSSNGTMAQFNIPELGGGGQWMQGGMTMVGDMFNNQLKYTVDGLCVDLSNLIHQGAIQYKPLPQKGEAGFVGNWWGDLGFPNSTGSQNGTSYAIFSNINRLAIQENGKVTVFDTLDNQIGGVGQQQGGNYSVTFTSQYGNVNLGTLPIISGGNEADNFNPIENSEVINDDVQNNVQNNVIETEVVPVFSEPIQEQVVSAINNNNNVEEDIFNKIERLAGLKDKGILSVEEFENKKTDLLSRL